MRKYTYDTDFFKQIDNEEKAYWLGFICADGFLNKRGNTVGICLDIIDLAHLEKFKSSISYTGNIFFQQSQYDVNHKFTSKASLEIYGKELPIEIGKYGLDYKKSKSLSNISGVPKELMHHFIRGVFDGDGCFFFQKPKKETHNISPGYTIVGTFNFLTFLCEFLPDVPRSLRFDNRTKGTYTLYICSVKRFLRFIDYIYKDATIYLDRKFLKHQDILNRIK